MSDCSDIVSLEAFRAKRAAASDEDATSPGTVNLRAREGFVEVTLSMDGQITDLCDCTPEEAEALARGLMSMAMAARMQRQFPSPTMEPSE